MSPMRITWVDDSRDVVAKTERHVVVFFGRAVELLGDASESDGAPSRSRLAHPTWRSRKLTTLLLHADLSGRSADDAHDLERVERSAVVSHHTTCSQPYGAHELRALARSAFVPAHLDRAIARAVREGAGARYQPPPAWPAGA
jgi:hypothetical protein